MKMQINTSGDLDYAEHGRIFDGAEIDPYYYLYPSLMVNSDGDMVIGFAGTKTNEYYSAFHSWRLANGSAPTTPSLIRTGLAPLDGEHVIGDYSHVTLDPEDETAFWGVQPFATLDGASGTPAAGWATSISQIKLRSPP